MATFYVREDFVCGIGPWNWIRGETGAWDGPSKEFSGIREMFLRHLSPDRRRVIVQAGGCLGMYPRLWAEDFEMVYTFEPDPINYQVLVENCRGAKNVHHYNAALGDSDVEVLLQQKSMSNVGMHQVYREGAPDGPIVRVPQMRIDDLNLEHCDAIQLDVESYEAYVLEGAAMTIKIHRPIISVETCDESVQMFFQTLDYVRADQKVSDILWVPKENK